MKSPGRGEFTCPVCGSHYFRTDLQRQIGQCKGHSVPGGGTGDYTGCTFTWPRAEDARVFETVEDVDGWEYS